jgi:hypothetical protein
MMADPIKVNPRPSLRELRRSELSEAAGLLGRGMRDNPNNIRTFGVEDHERRTRALTRFFRPVLHGLHGRGVIFGAFRDETLVGVCGVAPPGRCQPGVLEKLNVFVGVR